MNKRADLGDQNGNLGWSDGRASFCEVRDETIDGANPLNKGPVFVVLVW